jgi:1-acyl-sn-glycerol-3-phosphate acyltransferase
MTREAGRLYPVARVAMAPVFRFLWRFRVEGLHHVPRDGPAIIAPNHTSVIDSFFLPCVLPRRLTFVGKAEYLDDWKTRHLFPALGMIPIDRAGGDAAEAALAAAERVLQAGELFGIYPEGTRSRSGNLHKGHTGPARLALRTGAPIIPVGLIGTRAIQPPDAPFPKPFRPVVIRFGRPIPVERYRHRVDDRLLLRQLIDEVMFEIRELTGQTYVNAYAGKARDEPPAPAMTTADPVEPQPMPRRTAAEVLREAAARDAASEPDMGAGAEVADGAAVSRPCGRRSSCS